MRGVLAIMLAACSSAPHHVIPDASAGHGDGGTSSQTDGGSLVDGGNLPSIDGATIPPIDGGALPPVDAAPTGPVHIHILIANDCTTATDPTSLSEPSGSSVVLEFHNHSVDYQADVWNNTFNYGFLMLDTGATWLDDKAPVCQIHSSYAETFQIGPSGVDPSVCPNAFFTVTCGP